MPAKLPDFLKLIKGSLDDDGDEEVEMTLAEPVGFDPSTYDGMSSRTFGYILGSIPKGKKVKLNINTLGGRVDEGIAMHNMLLARGNVKTCVIGYAASMGAIIAQAGAVRQMMPGTMMIIHNPQAQASGDHNELRQTGDMIEQVKGNLVNLLSSRTSNSKRKISDMMDAVTSMTPEEAKELGFCDEIIDGSPAWNDLNFKPNIFFNSLRQITGCLSAPSASGGQPQKKDNEMKKILGALVAFGWVSSDALTEDQAVAEINANGEKNKTTVANHTNRVKAFEDAQKVRVTNKVEMAVTNKLVKAERKDALIATGMRDEAELDNLIGDITEAKGSTAPRRQGAPPLPVEGENDKTSTEEKIKTLQASLAKASPADRGRISCELRELRGHKNLFAAAATK